MKRILNYLSAIWDTLIAISKDLAILSSIAPDIRAIREKIAPKPEPKLTELGLGIGAHFRKKQQEADGKVVISIEDLLIRDGVLAKKAAALRKIVDNIKDDVRYHEELESQYIQTNIVDRLLEIAHDLEVEDRKLLGRE